MGEETYINVALKFILSERGGEKLLLMVQWIASKSFLNYQLSATMKTILI